MASKAACKANTLGVAVPLQMAMHVSRLRARAHTGIQADQFGRHSYVVEPALRLTLHILHKKLAQIVVPDNSLAWVSPILPHLALLTCTTEFMKQ